MSMADYVKNGLLQRGMPGYVADAFVANFRDESGLNPGINEANPTVPGSRGGFGLYQLTGPRRRSYETFANQRGVDPANPDAQLDFLMTELSGPEKNAANAIFGAKDTAGAAQAIVNKFLRPAEVHRAKRAAEYARLPSADTVSSSMGSSTLVGGAGSDTLSGASSMPQNGGLGGLGGYTPFVAPERDTGFDSGALLRAIGAGLIAGDASIIPAYLQDAQDRRDRRYDRQYDRARDEYEFNQTQQDKRDQRAAYTGALTDAGLSPERAGLFAATPGAATIAIAAADAKKDETIAAQSANRTADYAEKIGRPDIADAIRNRTITGAEGFKMLDDDRKGKGTYRILSADEAAGYGLPAGAYQQGSDGKISAISGGSGGGLQMKTLPDGTYGTFSPDTGAFNPIGRSERPASQGITVSPDGTVQIGGKVPSGFQPNPDKPGSIEPIPGGPAEQISGELAARLGLADTFLKMAPDLRKDLEAGAVTGPVDVFQSRNNQSSDAAEVSRKLEYGTEALVRMLTGAGMNQSEAEERTRRYMPTYTDTAASMVDKLDGLVNALNGTKDMAMRGRGGSSEAFASAPVTDYRTKYGLE